MKINTAFGPPISVRILSTACLERQAVYLFSFQFLSPLQQCSPTWGVHAPKGRARQSVGAQEEFFFVPQ